MRSNQPIVWVTAYDAWSASLAREAGVDAILMGDSVANVLLGYESTRELTLPEAAHHLRATLRGAGNIPVIMDIPWTLVRLEPAAAGKVAQAYIRAGARSVKVEWSEQGLRLAQVLSSSGIPFVGHIGLTPQTLTPKKWKQIGMTALAESTLLRQARNFESLGAKSVVLECVPAPMAGRITRALSCPTIGIGSGAECSGQVLVFHDITGLSPLNFNPRFVKRFANGRAACAAALTKYARAVRAKKFPDKRHSYSLDERARR